MTGSPVLEFKAISSKKQRILRKKTFGDVSEIQPDMSNLNNVAVPHPDSSNYGVAIDEINHLLSHTADAKAECVPVASKSVCSTSSSFAFPSKKGVKRKLNFDMDVGSDEVSSLKFSDQNMSLYGLRSKASSAADNGSLPEFRNVTLSPNKRRGRFSDSYSRSSVASVVSCRRRLFTESEPPLKKPKLTSPDLCKKKTEIKLSLKKKFPGVPNSDSARSGLLLNLAFSKYNLSNKKKDGMLVDFVDNTAVGMMTKKDLVRYSQIKKNESSLSRSPVFTAIKKVKRKLILEDQDTSGMANESSAARITQTNGITSGVPMLAAVSTTKETTASSEGPDVIRKLIGTINETDLNGQRDLLIVSNSFKHADYAIDSENFDLNDKSVTSLPPADTQTTNKRCDSPSFCSKKSNERNLKNNLFKNSKLRSTLRNKIYDLSKVKTANSEKSAVERNVNNRALFALAEKSSRNEECADFAKVQNQNDTHEVERFKSLFKLPECDRLKNIINDRDETNETNAKSGDGNRTFKSIPYRALPKKWLSCDSNLAKSFRQDSAIPECDRKFLKSHMNRFLKDCLVFVERKDRHKETSVVVKDEKRDDAFNNDEKLSTQLAQVERETENVRSPNRRVAVIENAESDATGNAASRSEPFVIENVDSQTESISIENVESQNEQSRFANFKDGPNNDTIDSLSSPPPEFTLSIDLEDVLANKKSSDLSLSVCRDRVVSSAAQSDGNLTKGFVPVDDAKIEPAITGVSYSCIQFTKPKEPTSTPVKNHETGNGDSLDTGKKIKIKKRTCCSLTHRLSKLLNREKSDFHMWKYEVLKNKYGDNLNTETANSAVFCIEKMWKEYSSIILQCSIFRQETIDISGAPDQLQSFTNQVSNAVIIILEQDYCPKDLTYSTVFQVHPPWKLLHFEKSDPLLVLKPRKISVISKDGNPILYKDPISFNCAAIKKQANLCPCENSDCNCPPPDRYQFLIKPLVASGRRAIEPKKFACLNYTDSDSFNSRCINDVVVQCKLFSNRYLNLDLQILHVHRYENQNEFLYRYVICVDERKHVCCVLVKGDVDVITCCREENAIFKFCGISLWKIVPCENVESFMQFVRFTNVPENIRSSVSSQSILIFTLSEKYGDVKHLRFT